MRFLYIDIDTLRPDHLGCYGYLRPTSPVIDAIAREGVRFDRCYASDTPCLPSRTALTTGRFGIRTGVMNHGGLAADPLPEGAGRQFTARLNNESWVMSMRRIGICAPPFDLHLRRAPFLPALVRRLQRDRQCRRRRHGAGARSHAGGVVLAGPQRRARRLVPAPAPVGSAFALLALRLISAILSRRNPVHAG